MTNPKHELRKAARKHRASMDPFAEDPEDAAKLFFETIKPNTNAVIAAYCPKGREFDALCIAELAIEKGHKTLLPVINKNNRVLTFLEWDKKTTMTANEFGIEEPKNSSPADPDIILVPLLAFDRRGTRLGQGGGYYDATLAHYRAQKDILAIGVAFSQQAVLFNLPKEDHDEPLDWVITPKEAHYYGEIAS
ncbi:MAG: 5-formyltetrahydrofolate cyclo-ligase [Bdellovibrionales bacterium]